jgi:hypothetical protein
MTQHAARLNTHTHDIERKEREKREKRERKERETVEKPLTCSVVPPLSGGYDV